jgi:hypothetical protein
VRVCTTIIMIKKKRVTPRRVCVCVCVCIIRDESRTRFKRMKKKNRVLFAIEDDHTLLNNLNGRVVIRDEFDTGCPGRGRTVRVPCAHTLLTDPGRRRGVKIPRRYIFVV